MAAPGPTWTGPPLFSALFLAEAAGAPPLGVFVAYARNLVKAAARLWDGEYFRVVQTEDSDNDGVKNLIEYALIDGGERGVITANSFAFTKRGAPYGSDITYGIETSTDLITWITPVSGVTENATTISYTFTPGSPPRIFARLKVTAP